MIKDSMYKLCIKQFWKFCSLCGLTYCLKILLLLLIASGSTEYACNSSQQQQTDPNFQDIPTQSWYPPSVVGSSSRPSTPTSSSASPHQRGSDHPQSSSRGQPSPAEAEGIIARLKDKPLAHILIFLDLLLSFLHTGPRPSRFLYLLGVLDCNWNTLLSFARSCLQGYPQTGRLAILSLDLCHADLSVTLGHGHHVIQLMLLYHGLASHIWMDLGQTGKSEYIGQAACRVILGEK
jgi:hypothetical protein